MSNIMLERNLVDKIENNGELLALIIRSNFNEPGINFFTDSDLSQQLAYMKHDSGKVIQPHVHVQVSRQVQFTQEVLFIRKGKIRADFYSQDQIYLESRVLCEGDVALLATGGHGFQVIDEAEIFEVKQGPYVGENDKVRFKPVDEIKVKIKE